MKTRITSGDGGGGGEPAAGTNCRPATMTGHGEPGGRRDAKSARCVAVGPEKLLATVGNRLASSDRAAALCLLADPRDASTRVIAGRWHKIGDMYVVYPDDGFDSLVTDVQNRGARPSFITFNFPSVPCVP